MLKRAVQSSLSTEHTPQKVKAPAWPQVKTGAGTDLRLSPAEAGSLGELIAVPLCPLWRNESDIRRANKPLRTHIKIHRAAATHLITAERALGRRNTQTLKKDRFSAGWKMATFIGFWTLFAGIVHTANRYSESRHR